MKSFFDVIIIGGGIAGSAAALYLQKNSDLSILLLDKSEEKTFRIGESIQAECNLFFNDLSINDYLKLNEKHLRSKGFSSYWGSDQLQFNDNIFNPYGDSWHLDRAVFDRDVFSILAEREICHLKDSFFVKSVKTTMGWEIECEKEYKTNNLKHKKKLHFHCRFIIDAGGRQSPFLKEQGATKKVIDNIICIYTFMDLKAGKSIDSYSLVESSQKGWWYSNLLPANKVIFSFFTDKENAEKLRIFDFDKWVYHLEKTIGIKERYKKTTSEKEKLYRCDASSYISDPFVGDNYLAVGDSLAAYDPLSSSGIFNALFSAKLASKSIIALLSDAKAIIEDNSSSLNDYETILKRKFRDYLKKRSYYYELEQRWSESSFWKSRNSKSYISMEER